MHTFTYSSALIIISDVDRFFERRRGNPPPHLLPVRNRNSFGLGSEKIRHFYIRDLNAYLRWRCEVEKRINFLFLLFHIAQSVSARFLCAEEGRPSSAPPPGLKLGRLIELVLLDLDRCSRSWVLDLDRCSRRSL